MLMSLKSTHSKTGKQPELQVKYRFYKLYNFKIIIQKIISRGRRKEYVTGWVMVQSLEN